MMAIWSLCSRDGNIGHDGGRGVMGEACTADVETSVSSGQPCLFFCVSFARRTCQCLSVGTRFFFFFSSVAVLMAAVGDEMMETGY